jgi:hypothetical protein
MPSCHLESENRLAETKIGLTYIKKKIKKKKTQTLICRFLDGNIARAKMY